MIWARDVADPRGFARDILARELGYEPVIVESPTGKPSLANADLAYNMSHAGDVCVVALAYGRALGVDVEPIRVTDPIGRARDIAAICEVALGILDIDDPATFARLWVRAEAICKATGAGLMFPVDLTVPAHLVVHEVVLPAAPDHVAALAIERFP